MRKNIPVHNFVLYSLEMNWRYKIPHTRDIYDKYLQNVYKSCINTAFLQCTNQSGDILCRIMLLPHLKHDKPGYVRDRHRQDTTASPQGYSVVR